MVDILVDLIPEIVTLVIAAAIVFARTTETAIDDKVAKAAKKHKPGIIGAIRTVLGEDGESRKKVRRISQGAK